MLVSMLKAKIHQATVTEVNVYYVGSITIDGEIPDKLNLHEYEHVHVVNINNGSRIETYIIRGIAGSGVFCLNGAAARFFHGGGKIIVMSYCQITNDIAKHHRPQVALLGTNNQISNIVDYELANSYE